MPRNDLETFIRSQILTTKRAPSRAAPPRHRCLEVKSVARCSPAGQAGVVPQDLLVSVNGQAAASLDPKLYRSPARRRTYLFFSPASQERVEVACSGIEPGLELKRTPESIAAGYKPESLDPAPLLELWEAGSWPALEKLSGQVLAAHGTRDTPALLLHGGALFEQARFEQGFALVLEYVRSYVSHWTQDYAGVAAYYLAMRKRMDGDKAAAVQLLADAYETAPFDRLADALVSLGQERPSTPVLWLHRQFPEDYELETIEGARRTLTLSEALLGLPAGRLFLVCLLDGYRANGPYNDFMRRFLEFATYFKPFLAGLHVITEDRERRPDRSYWFEWEDKARAAGAPFEVLLDPPGALGQTVSPPGSPYVVALDGRGAVLAERDLEGIDLWAALEAANAD